MDTGKLGRSAASASVDGFAYYMATGSALSGPAIRSELDLLEARVQFDAPARPLHRCVCIAPCIAVDMMDNPSALPTCPQRQQQKKTAVRKWSKIIHTTSRRGQSRNGEQKHRFSA
jgi:hypothetical protein